MVVWSVTSGLVVGLVTLAVLASYGFAWYSWRRADHPVSDRYGWLMFADGSWALLVLLQLLSPSDAFARLWIVPETMAAAFAAVFWFLFVIEYTGDSEWIPDAVEGATLAHAPAYTVLYLFNPGDLVFTDFGVARLDGLRLPYEELGRIGAVELGFVYVLLLSTFVLLGRFYVRTRNLYRRQTGVIFAVTLVTVLANVVYFAGLSPHPRLDLTPVFFVVQAAGVGFALYRYDFLNVAPLAASSLLEEMADPVFVVDATGRVVDWNDAAAEYVLDREQPTLSTMAIDGLAAAVDESGSDATEVTTTRRDSDRMRSVTYDVRTTPMTDQYDIVRGTVVVLRDVTDRRARQHGLETQNKRLEEFTGLVSHDLRNPLQVVSGHLELARQTGNGSHLDDATEAVERMERMLDDMLQLAREGQTIDEKEPVDLAGCARAAWETVGAPEATLALETEHSIAADPDRLQQVFENLFRNAIDHGGPGVAITVGEFDDGIYVADDGEGIPPAERDTVFDFGVTTDDDGSGFGLAIVERIVEAHGWTIRLRESAAGGARFELTTLYPSSFDD